MWFIFSALAGLLYTGESLLQRHFLRKQKDAWAFSFFYSFVGTGVSLPFMLAAPVVPHTVFPWLGALLVGLLIVGNNLFLFKAATTMEMSLIGALFKLKTLGNAGRNSLLCQYEILHSCHTLPHAGAYR